MIRCLSILLLALPASAVESSRSSIETTANRMVCGPQCVWYVLRAFGIDTDQTDLIRRTQWPKLEGGTSLDDLSQLLQEHGLHTTTVRVDRRFPPRPVTPVIVHFKPAGETSLGHFVVLLPGGEEGRRRVWEPGRGEQTWEAYRLAERMSGALLPTSTHEIRDPADVLDGGRSTTPYWLAGLAACQTAILCSLFYRTTFRRRSPECPASARG